MWFLAHSASEKQTVQEPIKVLRNLYFQRNHKPNEQPSFDPFGLPTDPRRITGTPHFRKRDVDLQGLQRGAPSLLLHRWPKTVMDKVVLTEAGTRATEKGAQGHFSWGT